MPLGVVQFIPVYHSLHDGFQIHSETCVLLFLSLFFLVAWTSDRRPSVHARTATLSGEWLAVLSTYAETSGAPWRITVKYWKLDVVHSTA